MPHHPLPPPSLSILLLGCLTFGYSSVFYLISSYTPVFNLSAGVSVTVAGESALRSAGTLLSRVRAPSSALRPDGEPQSLKSL
ncbi:hypothetical protein PoB_004422700 [Plakobranchus ocellatus]|uniref:Uncharacterized protein n=1 Tax=Plakobranchus ocellatus TaxID=259542 RepID=A0AAV4BE58_9GAST|nr:hypothetical protein PoB_004422700 [Plakobranchus ocellatus]